MGQSSAALWLEKNWTKAQILEAYLNLVSFRGEQVGVAAMSVALFDKIPAGLNAEDAALAAVLIRAPNVTPDKAAQRACMLLPTMKLTGITPTESCSRIRVRAQSILARTQGNDPEAMHLAPHFSQRLLVKQNKLCQPSKQTVRFTCMAGRSITSTLDAKLQRYATTVLRRHLLALASRNVKDGAIVVLDNQSGDILAWVGSSGSALSDASEVDIVSAERQAGSILKPFLYQLAIQGRWVTAASLLEDSPLDLQTASGIYAPENYAKDSKGLISVRTALAASLNIPAVRVLEIVSPQRLRDRLVDLGMSSLVHNGEHYGYSLALGGADVRLIDIANAYRVLANQGLYSPPRWTMNAIRNIPIRKLDAASSFIINDILSDRTARARTFGFESALSTAYWSAVKTGTSKDMRDNWAVGFSKQYTVAVWVGNAGGEPMWDVSGMHGAAPVWESVLNYLQQYHISQPPLPPAGVVRRQVRYDNMVEATRQEWFLSGTQRERIIAHVHNDQLLKPLSIASPLDGSIYALDPDIPQANQRMLWRIQGAHHYSKKKCVKTKYFQETYLLEKKRKRNDQKEKLNERASCTSTSLQWWLNGKYIGTGEMFYWFPWPGQYQLELRGANGQSVQRISFSVRGASVSSAKSNFVSGSIQR
jgi:penicillin-binding protein 1C